MDILVTGGAGYIGSVVCAKLLTKGHHIVALDNLSAGHREALLPGVEFIQADICDSRSLDELFQRPSNMQEAVMHMAAETVVGYSATDRSGFSVSTSEVGSTCCKAC